MRNTYVTRFIAMCPVNGRRIDYTLTIKTGGMLKVEDILQVVSEHPSGFHEDIADILHARLGGDQTLDADHHGVHITTERR